jgi:hypothetical protein
MKGFAEFGREIERNLVKAEAWVRLCLEKELKIRD